MDDPPWASDSEFSRDSFKTIGVGFEFIPTEEFSG